MIEGLMDNSTCCCLLECVSAEQIRDAATSAKALRA